MDVSPKITYIGHATILIEMDGVRMITDPFFRSWVWHLSRIRLAISPEWYNDIDAILISHAHWDHLDIASLRRFSPDTKLLAPAGTRPLFKKSELGDVHELQTGEQLQIGDVTIHATYAEHNGSRGPFSPDLPCLGFLVQGSKSIYFTGDTALFSGMADIAPDLDIAMLPVWGWGPTLGEGHMNPQEAAEAASFLSPRIAIPIHWGTLYPIGLRWFLPRYMREPPLAFADQVARVAPDIQVNILKPGESFSL